MDGVKRALAVWDGLAGEWCRLTHGGGHIQRDPTGRVNWQCNKCGRWAEPVSQEDEAAVTEFALRSACSHLGTLVDRQREALRAARTMIQEHREKLVRGHFDPKTGSVDEDGQRGLDEYDAVLAQIDALLPDPVIPHDPTRTP